MYLYYISVCLKLAILEFSSNIYFHFDLGHFYLRPKYEPQQPQSTISNVAVYVGGSVTELYIVVFYIMPFYQFYLTSLSLRSR